MTLTFSSLRATVITYTQKFKVNGQLVPKIEWKQMDGRTAAIALPPSLMRSVIMGIIAFWRSTLVESWCVLYCKCSDLYQHLPSLLGVFRVSVGDMDSVDTATVWGRSLQVSRRNLNGSDRGVGRRAKFSTFDCHKTTSSTTTHRYRDDHSQSVHSLLYRYAAHLFLRTNEKFTLVSDIFSQ